jgi:hypothetical protein
VRDHEHDAGVVREDGLPAVGEPRGGRVEALAVRERDVARVAVLPGAVLLDQLALELADVDVVEERLRVRGKRVWTQRSIGMFATWTPSSRASRQPRSVSGTATVGSPFTRRSWLSVDSA